MQKIIRGLEEAPREDGSTARGALAALTALGLAGPRAGSSIARCSGIKILLTSLVSSQFLSGHLRCSSLRALASVCCCLEAVDCFINDGGPEILTDILISDDTPLNEKSEAAALLVQIISPWMDFAGLPYVEGYSHLLVPALTELAEKCSCSQTLLLATAGLNYLSRAKRGSAMIIENDSVKKILRCVKRSAADSIWLMEQVASMIGQLARDPKHRAHLAEARASVALVCFLRMQPPGLEQEYKKLVETTTEALTRLCVDQEIAKQVVALGGSNCITIDEQKSPDLSNKESDKDKTRNHSKATKSLRMARRIAAEQIDIARICDSSPG